MDLRRLKIEVGLVKGGDASGMQDLNLNRLVNLELGGNLDPPCSISLITVHGHFYTSYLKWKRH